jgi:tetratricopeptide (TPR) repeat protein
MNTIQNSGLDPFTKPSSSSSSSACLIITVLAALSLFAGCKRAENSPNPAQTSPPQNAGPAGAQPYFKTSFQDESQFVVENIVTDIAEMLCFARNRSLPSPKAVVVDARGAGGDPDAPVYDVTVQTGSAPALHAKLTVSGPIWSEAVYADLTSALAHSLQLPSPSNAPGEDISLLGRLADGLPETIAREDLELSAQLQKDFKSPGLHEQAAALLGAFALLENSGLFYDIRLPLCRMTAHLVLARFLSGDHPPGPVGHVADCMLLTLMNNQVEGVKQIEHLDTAQEPVAIWARVLRAYNTLDFRPLDAATNVPGIEQIAWFAAYSAANNRNVAWKRVGQAVERQPDFCRIAGALGYGVEIGNVMLQSWLPLEFREVSQVCRLLQGRELRKEDFIVSLNSAEDRCFVPQQEGPPQVRVIGWGLWAMQLQHHLCLAVTSDFHSLRDKLDLPEESWQFASQSEQQFGHLRFYGFVRRLDCTNEATYRASTDEGWAFAVQYPHLAPVAWMDYLCGKVSFAPRYMPIPNPHCNEWTSHNPLPGTAYDVDARLDYPSFTGGDRGIKKVFKVHEMAPYDLGICKYIGRWYTTNWTYEAANSTFGPLLPYSAVAAACIADSQANNPEQYEKFMELAVKWDPSFYRTLAEYEWNHGKTNEAMSLYERQEQSDPDAVSLANLAERRVRYYLATGQKQKAKETADFAGEVYSAGGLAAKAVYFEETGNLARAFDWFGKIEERYRDADELLFFCCRHVGASGDANLDRRMADRLQTWYNEREKASLSSFSGPPADGVSLSTPGPALERLSVKKGDIIVAARGIRIHNMTQLKLARDMDRAPELKIVYWQGSGYREATVALNAEHRLGATMLNYAAK